MQKYLNRFDLHIVKTLKKNFVYSKLIISTSDKYSEEPLNLRSEQVQNTLSSTGWRHSMEWRNGGMAEYSTSGYMGLPYCKKQKSHKNELQWNEKMICN